MSESLAQNTIDNRSKPRSTSAKVMHGRAVTVDATEDARYGDSAAASVSASIGFSGSAGAAVALNTIDTNTRAYRRIESR